LLSNFQFTTEILITILIASLVLGIGGVIVANKSDDPIVSFIGYNMLVIPFGVSIASTVQMYSSKIVFEAFVMTLLITIIMMLVSSLYPRVFLSLGRMLFVALLGLIAAGFVCVFALGTYPTILSIISAGIFSLYIGYDWVSAQTGYKTLDNAIDSALDIYLDIVNLFLDLLQILAASSDD
jgi:FtsH-binding integral membrane protein